MIWVILSAAFVGIIHSLAPAHWLPVVLVARSRRWNNIEVVQGALAASAGHILSATVLGLLAVLLGSEFIHHVESVERFSGVVLVVLGLGFAGYAYLRHFRCEGHTHHGPDLRNKKMPFWVLFTVGLSPCFAVVPPFLAAAPYGDMALGFALAAFAFGVVLTLGLAALFVSRGLVKLDHPFLEHYGDVIAGVGIAVIGIVLWVSSSGSHSHF